MAGRSFHGPVPELTEDETELRGRLESHVRALAGDIGERNVLTPNALARAEEYIRRVFDGSGYPVAEHTYDMPLDPSLAVRNIEVEISGTTPPGEIVIVGAHYDTVPFRYPHSHTPQDTPDRIDYDRFTRVVMGVSRVVEVLADAQ